ncbi:PREDICTED: putative pentatricopeptide repeat-containing protein At3g15930 isoform X2 [Tarenaya hassleriana]|uniref:putative pentatricopeptide repeat-containing protein At3g15930 isoform X1 n=1 Tax=Tarenaya hassleriana TaxID=28532 RepID=UPI00053C418E|nr:PREDICTED: putative pentatricopeptide repeat-containing protein At3g15930 isoform X1 [Tarenaya hassleriana]XP_010542247.1 PREDICTED: putative pentatricopeptide repeat-containing protein At3g15930 isoform X2 [Tarenaya hassleriana]
MILRLPLRLKSPKASTLRLFISTMAESVSRDYTCLIDACKTMDQLKQMHSLCITTGMGSDPRIQKKLLVCCCSRRGGEMGHACKLFDRMHERDLVVWNTMIKGWSKVGCDGKGVTLYMTMLKNGVMPDYYTFPFLLNGLNRDCASDCCRQLHCHVVKFGFESNVYVQNGIVYMYSLCGLMDMARRVFDMRSKDDVFAWNLMLSGYNRMNQYEESRALFLEMEVNMVFPTRVTLVLILAACSKLRDKDLCRRVHGYVKECKMEPGLKLENALINAYAACNEMDVAEGIFKSMKIRDVISWTSIVKGFVETGNLELARTYFDQMPERDNVSWTAIIDGYLRAGFFKESLELFRQMQSSGIKPDEYTMVSVITACSHLGALEIGEWAKTYIDRYKIKNDVVVGNALIDMYFKCGCVSKAQKIFNDMIRKDKFTWTAMVVGLANNGHGEEALKFFSQMVVKSIQPDEITYLGVLSACSHTGMVDQGRNFFAKMTSEHGIEPRLVHYGCMVDLLSRAGMVKEAYEVILNMPMNPNSIIWGTLLSACRVHKDTQLAELAAEKILQLEQENGAVYTLLCNTYAACGRWEDLRGLRRKMMERGIKKKPGFSSIEVDGFIHEFVAGDRTHLQADDIYMELEEMTHELKLAGYLPDTTEALLEYG